MSDTEIAPTKPAAELQPQADQPYEVEYGKPPESTRFKKGQSGNPQARRKPKSAAETAAFLLGRPVTITENGKRRRVTMQEAVVLSQVKRAVAGDHKAAKMLLELSAQAPPPPPPDMTVDEMNEVFTEVLLQFPYEEQLIIARFNAQIHVAAEKMKARKAEQT